MQASRLGCSGGALLASSFCVLVLIDRSLQALQAKAPPSSNPPAKQGTPAPDVKFDKVNTITGILVSMLTHVVVLIDSRRAR